MDWFLSSIRSLAHVLEAILLLFSVYTIALAVVGLRRPKSRPSVAPQKRFALITAAHNEAEVIGPHVESLLHLDYPRELFDIYIICDNCTDETAEIVSAFGVNALIRHDTTKRGKGFAIEWALERVLGGSKKYDAICMFDADNLVSPNYVSVMNNYLCAGSKAVQSYLDSKNPWDSWISAVNSVNFWTLARTWQAARANVGLSSALMGTGLCLDTGVLRELGWGATCLTEDLEYTSKMINRGMKVDWAHEVRVYDEKPLTFAQTWKQRMRWVQGHWNVAARYTWPLLKRGLTTFSWQPLDMAIYLMQPGILIFWTVESIVNVTGWVSGHPIYISLAAQLPPSFMISISVLGFVYPALGMAADRVPAKTYWYYPLYLVYSVSWVPIVFIAFFKRNETGWSHTKHTRGLRLNQLSGQAPAQAAAAADTLLQDASD